MDVIEKHLAKKKRDGEICIHYWVIEPPTGPTSKGICKRCGSEREFVNSPQDVSFTSILR